RFYRDALGFEVSADVTDPSNPENRWLTLKPKSGDTSVMILKLPGDTPSDRTRSANMVLATDDLAGDCERIRSHGGTILHPPRGAGWGNALETHFRAPGGNVYLLVQQLG